LRLDCSAADHTAEGILERWADLTPPPRRQG